MFDKVIIVLHYISKESLFKKVENLNLNRELNELAQDKRLRLTNETYNKLDKKKNLMLRNIVTRNTRRIIYQQLQIT